jgi:broad specificity phosphatase PhoE
MKLFLIRHGESIANKEGHRQGNSDEWTDTNLTELGLDQAKLVGERLSNEKIDRVYVSSYKRARQTAEAITNHHTVDIRIDERLRESFNAESDEEFTRRLQSAMQEIEGDNVGKTVMVVAHGNSNREILRILGITSYNGKHKYIQQGNTAVSILEKEGDHYKVHILGCVKHLEADTKIIKLFEQVQKIPYKVCSFSEEEIDENLDEGDCRHKTFFLKRLLEEEGYHIGESRIVFDWKDLPIPADILAILQKSSTVWTHKVIRTRIHGFSIFFDPFWDDGLIAKGFPVTSNWNGLEDTKQITNGELHYYYENDYQIHTEKIHKKHGISIDKEEAHKFAEALNKWLRE